jgi:3D (Asp-Asp-Asp) domain-containing protein
VSARKSVSLVIDGRRTAITTQASRVADVLDDAGVPVADGDVVTPPVDARVTSGMTVLVKHAIPVTIDLGGERVQLDVVGETVADALVAAGAGLAGNAGVRPAVYTPLKPGMVISAPEVFVRIISEEATLAPTLEMRADSRLAYGRKVLVSKGAPGRVLRVYRVVVANGVEGQRVLSAERVILRAKPRVIRVGTHRTFRLFGLLRGNEARPVVAKAAPKAGQRMTVVATGYSAAQPGLDPWTATGRKATYGVIAVDPSVIPLGTKVWVPGYGYAIAADTGGAIRGNRIDLCFDSVADAKMWGRRSVTIVICK